MERLRASLWLASAAVICSAAAALISAWPASGAAAPSCVGSLATENALTTVSADGTRVVGSACPDHIVVTSRLVREVVGGGGNDVISVNPWVAVVDGGEGDDVIYGELPEELEGGATADVPQPSVSYEPETAAEEELATASIETKECSAGVSCYGGIGSQKLIGSSGNDKIFGQRGNDQLFGNAGNDQLFGGIGDDSAISGGADNDLLSGGLGTDVLDGGAGSDLARGDGTIDVIEDSGGAGTDTLSFATGVTPGFAGSVVVSGFPGEGASEERGVYVRLDGSPACGIYQACNNSARLGGGNDEIAVAGFENVIGSPFADEIVGSGSANKIYGGGGVDLVYGGGGNDEIYGGADGDYLSGGEGSDTVFGQGGTNHCGADAETQSGCSGSTESVVQRDRSKISVGFMTAGTGPGWVELYAVGSTGTDRVTASFGFEGPTGYVNFQTSGESAAFDTSGDAGSEFCTYTTTQVKCLLPTFLDSIVMAGMAGDDVLTINASEKTWETTSPVLLGGQGNDELVGSGVGEDVLVDADGNDVLKALAYDDALLNNEGTDTLEGGAGNDLLVSSGGCQGDILQGAESGAGDGAAQNSASWAQVPSGEPGVVADLETEGDLKGTAGNVYSGGPACASGTLGKLRNIDDLEGTNGDDILYGDSHENNLLGRKGKDQLWARGGNDNIEAADGEADQGGGSTGTDTCTLDPVIDSFNSCNP